VIKFLKSLFTDIQWDGDLTKVVGFAIVACGIVGWFLGRDPVFMLGFGGALIASGKFSAQG
jgi:hypothetical protein